MTRNYIDDTICAPATVPGTGAISVVRLSGSDAIKIADKVLGGVLKNMAGFTVKFVHVNDNDGSVLDDVLATVFRAPHSYTGEDSVEISCHASSYIVERLVAMLLAAGSVGTYGIVLLTALTLVYLVSTENFGVPLGAPFAPFIRRDLRDTFVKYNLLSLKERPASLSSPNKRRQK